LEEAVFVGAAGLAAMSEEVAGACRAVAEGVTGKGRATMGRPWTGSVRAVGVVLRGRKRGTEFNMRSLTVRMW
jgi:hypothetical protein